MRILPLLACFSLFACGGKDSDPVDTASEDTGGEPEVTDRDGDGVDDDEDCAPDDPYSYPGMDEIPYDGRDNDCLGDGDLTDVDGDGFAGAGAGGDDCNDNNPDAFPGAPETCQDRYEGHDMDCSGDTGPTDDCDGDGSPRGTDCNEEDPAIYPGAPETWYDGVDQDCGYDDDDDADRDGDPSADRGGRDCDDADPTRFYGQDELLDGTDNDCDDRVDVLSATDSVVEWSGDSYTYGDGLFGYAVKAMDDLDGDGFREVAFGAPTSAEGAGRLYVVAGAGETAGGTAWENNRLLVEGPAAATLGAALAPVGDLTGDGAGDWLVGAPGRVIDRGTGGALLFSGVDLAGAGTLDPASALVAFGGVTSAGYAVSAVGDVDDDGVVDLGTSPGTAGGGFVVVSGVTALAGGELGMGDALCLSRGSDPGGAFSGGANLDGDGWPDLVVSTGTSGDGQILVVGAAALAGPYFNAEADGVVAWTGASGAQLGTRATVVPDADGDGYDEVLASAPGLAGAVSAYGGVVYLVPGSSTLVDGAATDRARVTLQGTVENGWLLGAESTGDLDGDGRPDVAVSHVGYNPDGSLVIESAVYLFLGDTLAAGGTFLATDGDASIESRSSGDSLGWAVDLSDIDQDGLSDVLVTATTTGAGMAWLYWSGLGG